MRGADFLFFRDTLSLGHVRRRLPGLRHAAFGADAAFACTLRDDARAEDYLREVGLEPGRFICVVPRLRWTPYYRLHGRQPNDADHRRHEVNARTKTADYAALREMITRWVRETGMSVLACAEMTHESSRKFWHAEQVYMMERRRPRRRPRRHSCRPCFGDEDVAAPCQSSRRRR